MTEALVDQIRDGFADSALSDRHKLVVRYADVFLTDPSSIGADLREEMLKQFRPAEIVELTAGLALFMGFSKIAIVLGQEPDEMQTTILPTPTRPQC